MTPAPAPSDPAPSDPASSDPAASDPAPSDPTALAADLREALRPLLRRFKEHRTLSMGKIGIMVRLEQGGQLAATDLAGLERISHQAVATAVRELEEAGLVSRAPDPDDRRRALIDLTPAGRDRLAAERSAGQDWLAHAVATHLDAAERATLAAAVPLLHSLDTADHPVVGQSS